MVIRKLTELSELKENYQKLQGNYNELELSFKLGLYCSSLLWTRESKI